MILIQIHQGTDFSNEKNMDVKNNSYHEPEPQILYEPDPEPPIKKNIFNHERLLWILKAQTN